MDQLSSILSWAWNPYIVQFCESNSKATSEFNTYNKINKESFEEIKLHKLNLRRKMNKFSLWSLKDEYHFWAYDQLSLRHTASKPTPTIRGNKKWEIFTAFLNDLRNDEIIINTDSDESDFVNHKHSDTSLYELYHPN